MNRLKTSFSQHLTSILFLSLPVALASCGGMSEPSVSVESLIEEYEALSVNRDAKGSDAWNKEYQALLSDPYASPLGNQQGLCTLSTWWIEYHRDYSQTPLVKRLELLYNVCAYRNSMCADYEIWERAISVNGEGMVPRDSVLTAIRESNVRAIQAPELFEAALRMKNQTIAILQDSITWSDSSTQYDAVNEYDSLKYNLQLELLDTTLVDSYFEEVDTMLAAYSSVQEEISQLDASERFRATLERVKNAKNFDEQCAIALVCASRQSTFSFWSLTLLKHLLSSGRYSVLLARMWLVWRALAQYEFFGISRDSYIPNYNYDQLRKTAYKTILRRLSTSSSDSIAINQAIFLADSPVLLRNGYFFAGNDAPIEMSNYCPDFFEEQE